MLKKAYIGLCVAALTFGVGACSTISQAVGSPPPVTPRVQGATQPTSDSSTSTIGSQPGVAGTVESISGSTLTLQSPRNSGTITVQVTGSTAIRKQVIGSVADIKTGETIAAIGQEGNGVLEARQIQLGVSPSAPGALGDGTPRTRGGTGNRNITTVRGAVLGVSGGTITVKTDSGSAAQVRLAPNGRVVEQAVGTTADIAPGDFVVVDGQRLGNTLTATSLAISPGRPGGSSSASSGS